MFLSTYAIYRTEYSLCNSSYGNIDVPLPHKICSLRMCLVIFICLEINGHES